MIRWSETAEKHLNDHYRLMQIMGYPDPYAVLDRIFAAVEQLPINPKLGKRISEDLYKLTIRSPRYVIHYSVGSEILIVGVYHHRQTRPFS